MANFGASLSSCLSRSLTVRAQYAELADNLAWSDGCEHHAFGTNSLETSMAPDLMIMPQMPAIFFENDGAVVIKAFCDHRGLAFLWRLAEGTGCHIGQPEKRSNQVQREI